MSVPQSFNGTLALDPITFHHPFEDILSASDIEFSCPLRIKGYKELSLNNPATLTNPNKRL